MFLKKQLTNIIYADGTMKWRLFSMSRYEKIREKFTELIFVEAVIVNIHNIFKRFSLTSTKSV